MVNFIKRQRLNKGLQIQASELYDLFTPELEPLFEKIQDDDEAQEFIKLLYVVLELTEPLDDDELSKLINELKSKRNI